MSARVLVLLAFVLPTATFAEQVDQDPSTEIVDAGAAKKLLGKRALTLQWITFEAKTKGAVDVSNDGGVYRITGEQRDAKGNFVTVEGQITKIEKTQFFLRGKIVTRVDHIAGGEPCPREGTFRFHIKGARKFWRLQEMQNLCEGGNLVDYVDVHFASK
jgi:hypothetical protein